jgi:hypothetical protein
MGRKPAASPGLPRETGGELPGRTAPRGWQKFAIRGSLVAAAILASVGILAFAVSREATTTARMAPPELARPVPAPQRPAFTRAEETYIQALWPIHGEVERTTVRTSLGKIFYKTNDLGKADLKKRIDEALGTYRRAEARISGLQPPSSLQPAHDDYLAAVKLFEQSALEVLKMFDDGNDDHLLAAYPLSQEGSNKIREVGVRFWQDEFPPN